jgi:hypothetical protein
MCHMLGTHDIKKKIADVRSQYFWPGMKKKVVNYIAR